MKNNREDPIRAIKKDRSKETKITGKMKQKFKNEDISLGSLFEK